MDKAINWLFTDPTTSNFHFYVPWMIVCALGLLIPIYYWLEARKRFFWRNALHKYLLDKFTRQLWPIAFVGWFLIAFRYAQLSIFSWRAWRYAWAIWLVALLAYWAYYMIARYRGERARYLRQRELARYYPQIKARRRTAKAGAR